MIKAILSNYPSNWFYYQKIYDLSHLVFIHSNYLFLRKSFILILKNFHLIFIRNSFLSAMFTLYHTCLLMKFLVFIYENLIIVQMTVLYDINSQSSILFLSFFHNAFRDFWIKLILWMTLRDQNKDLVW